MRVVRESSTMRMDFTWLLLDIDEMRTEPLELKQRCDARHGLAVPEVEESTAVERTVKMLDHGFSRGFAEIDKNVATEYEIHVTNRPHTGALTEVEMTKFY